MRNLTAIVFLVNLCGCSHLQPEPWVKAYERGHLADPVMKLERSAVEHIYGQSGRNSLYDGRYCKGFKISRYNSAIMRKIDTAVNLFGFILIVAVMALNSCNRYSLCYDGSGLQLYERGSRGYELAQHNPNCAK